MPGLVPGIHVLERNHFKDVDGRDKPGHDDVDESAPNTVGIITIMSIDLFSYTICSGCRRPEIVMFALVVAEIIKTAVALFAFYGSAVLLICWAMAAGPLLLAYSATAVLYLFELVVRRIAEYPKGPILAVSAICGGVAALLKFFSSSS
jgi:hypothetical protein